jgi:hypothetical protein
MLALSVGKELQGRYVVLGVLGSGGYATVWRATDKQLNRDVALKRLLKTGTYSAVSELELVLAEAQKHAQLIHTNIVQLYDVIECEGDHLMVMEFVDGSSLLEVLRKAAHRCEVLPMDRSIAILRDVLSGLSFAHDKHIVHRDLSPANILLTSTSIAKIADFGIATMVPSPSSAVGSAHGATGNPHFMSPEQQRGEPADQSSDLFMIGIIGYLLMTGTHPYSHPSGLFSIPELLQDVNYSPQTPRPISELTSSQQRLFREYSAIIMRLLNRERAGRFGSARDAIIALEAVTPFQECPHCGERLPEHFQFCGYCGASTASPPHEAVVVPAVQQKDRSADEIVEAGFVLSQQRRWDDAIAQYQLALDVDCNNQKAYRNLGFALNRVQRFEEAETALTRGLELSPEMASHQASLAYERALARAELKKYDGAIEDVTRALKLVPRSVKSRYLLARIYLYRGATEEARREALEVLRAVPDHAGALRLLDQIN